ncbi:glutathione synthetase ATP-binding domain-like protein [Wolfiporia cocos MD-104 SS10]|uniref:Glutathione synthetase ATP-binding domain-like protein n=1 Tax=Wolfiporia cocos (strain MD-104) TaxID=742152 RepID=A0A2H3JBJ8_WOLCO|nr:glutathione synthetase ATP-binding domain-like protein [Wolfiporia cocos MD-104 SS10]
MGGRKPHFDKILIVNQGEIACHVICTSKKLGICIVSIYSKADADALHVCMPDEAYCIGPAPSAQSYLCIDKIIDVCKQSGAQASSAPRLRFLSENTGFAHALADAGITFIRPPQSTIVSTGSKRHAYMGIPIIPGYYGSNQDPDFLAEQAEHIGLPVLIKVMHSGGGKGMCVMHTHTGFPPTLESAWHEVEKSFGNGAVLVKHFVKHLWHIKVQVFAAADGRCISLWERDWSVQMRNQKIIRKVSPALGLSPEIHAELSEKVVVAACAVGYLGAGTVEFIFDKDMEKFYFMEMWASLAKCHAINPVMEMITNLDLVEWQLEVAVWNPRNQFLPDLGKLSYLSTLMLTHVFAPAVPITARSTSEAMTVAPIIDTMTVPSIHIEQGFRAGLVVHRQDCTEVLHALRGTLKEYCVVGVSTNVKFLQILLGHEAFVVGDVEMVFILKHEASLFPAVGEPDADVLMQHLHGRPAGRWLGGGIYEWLIMTQMDNALELIVVHILPHAQHMLYVTVHTADSECVFRNISAHLIEGTTLSMTIDGTHCSTTVICHASVPPRQSICTSSTVHIRTVHMPALSWLLALGGDTQTAAHSAFIVVNVCVNVGNYMQAEDLTVLCVLVVGVIRAVGCKKDEIVEDG